MNKVNYQNICDTAVGCTAGHVCISGELHDGADESVLSETEIEGQDVFNTVWLIHGCIARGRPFRVCVCVSGDN